MAATAASTHPRTRTRLPLGAIGLSPPARDPRGACKRAPDPPLGESLSRSPSRALTWFGKDARISHLFPSEVVGSGPPEKRPAFFASKRCHAVLLAFWPDPSRPRLKHRLRHRRGVSSKTEGQIWNWASPGGLNKTRLLPEPSRPPNDTVPPPQQAVPK
jgi:hypothetical protein